MMAYLEDGEEPSIEDLKRCIRKGAIALDFFPTFVVQPLRTRAFSSYSTRLLTMPGPTEVDPQPEVDLTVTKQAM